MKSEKGYALILVMIIISVTMIGATALTSTALSTTKQFNKTDDRNKATDLAEMGITHFVTLSKSIINDTNVTAHSSDPINFCKEVINELDDEFDGTEEFIDGENRYVLSLLTTEDNCESITNEIIKMSFSSTGITDTNENINLELEGTFDIRKPEPESDEETQNSDIPDVLPIFQDINDYATAKNLYIYGENGDQNNIETGETSYPAKDENGNDIHKYYEGEFKFSNGDKEQDGEKKVVTINNIAWFDTLKDNGNRKMLINNLAIFDSISDINFSGNKDMMWIVVDGDAVFWGPLPPPYTVGKNGKVTYFEKRNVCVTGKKYIKESGQELREFDNTTFYQYFNEELTCTPSDNDNNNETDVSNWYFDNSSLEVIYDTK